MVDGGRAGLGSYVEEDTDIRLEDGSESVEEPSVRVDLSLTELCESVTVRDLLGGMTFF